jgi:hypothetical protein
VCARVSAHTTNMWRCTCATNHAQTQRLLVPTMCYNTRHNDHAHRVSHRLTQRSFSTLTTNTHASSTALQQTLSHTDSLDQCDVYAQQCLCSQSSLPLTLTQSQHIDSMHATSLALGRVKANDRAHGEQIETSTAAHAHAITHNTHNVRVRVRGNVSRHEHIKCRLAKSIWHKSVRHAHTRARTVRASLVARQTSCRRADSRL